MRDKIETVVNTCLDCKYKIKYKYDINNLDKKSVIVCTQEDLGFVLSRNDDGYSDDYELPIPENCPLEDYNEKPKK